MAQELANSKHQGKLQIEATKPLLQAPTMVAGTQVKKDWLKSQPTQEGYRAHLERAFQIAENRLTLRKMQRAGGQADKNLEKATVILETQKINIAGQDTHKTCDPEVPQINDGRMMMTKIGRNCMKKQLTRYFDVENQELVYYDKQDGKKPSKRLPMKEVKITIESQQEEEKKGGAVPKAENVDSKHFAWHNKDMPYRLKIVMPARAQVPIFHYISGYQEAQLVKQNMKQMLQSEEEVAKIKDLIKLVCILFKIVVLKPVFYEHMLSLTKKTREKVRFYRTLHAISSNFTENVIDAVKLFNTLPRVKAPVERQIVSSFRNGMVANHDYSQNAKAYLSLIQMRALRSLQRLIKNRRRSRPLSFTKQIARISSFSTFPVITGAYKVNPTILSTFELPAGWSSYTLKDAQQVSEARVSQEKLVFIDQFKREYQVPLSEISHMAVTPENSLGDTWELELGGRRIRKNDQIQGQNILANSVGFERAKYSRLDQKEVIKISLKGISIPEKLLGVIASKYQYSFQENQGRQIIVPQLHKSAIFRLRFELDSFYAESTFFLGLKQGQNQLDLTEDITLDLFEGVKNIKIALMGAIGRANDEKYSMLNEITFEEELGSYILNTDSFQANGAGDLQQFHFTLSDTLLETLGGLLGQEKSTLSCRIERKTVRGDVESCEMEGAQLLVGKHVIYDKKIVAQVVKIVDKKNCEIELLSTQRNIGQYPDKRFIANIKRDLSLIEHYGLSVYNLQDLPPLYQPPNFEWTLRLSFSQRDRTIILAKVNEAIQNDQVSRVFQQRMQGKKRVQKKVDMTVGTLDFYLLSAHNLPAAKKPADQTYLQISFETNPDMTPEEQRAEKDMRADAGFEESFIITDKNIQEKVGKIKQVRSTALPAQQEVVWWTEAKPEGNVFKLGSYIKKIPIIFKLTLFTLQNGQDVPLGFATLNSEDLISLTEFSRTHLIYLTEPKQLDSYICLRTVFTPSPGTVQRNRLQAPSQSQLLCQEALQTIKAVCSQADQLARVPRWELEGQAKALLANATFYSKLFKVREDRLHISYSIADQAPLFELYKGLSPAQGLANPGRSDHEDDTVHFSRALLGHRIQAYTQALSHRNLVLWEGFIEEVMKSGDADPDMLDDLPEENFSVAFSNTTKYLNKMFQNRLASKLQNKKQLIGAQQDLPEGLKFSAIFASEWKKEDMTDPNSWKYATLWHLLVLGVPNKLRIHLWNDFLRVRILQKQSSKYGEPNRLAGSAYQRFKKIALDEKDSPYAQQIEQDIRDYSFQGVEDPTKRDWYRYKACTILKALGVWASDYAQSKNKALIYNKSMIPILTRFLLQATINAPHENARDQDSGEEAAFWMLVGMIVNTKKIFSHDNPSERQQEEQRGSLALDKRADMNKEREIRFCPLLSRKVCFKNEMVIINLLIKIHYPEVFDHLKSLSLPLEWYFYDAVSSFYADILPQEVLWRLWDLTFLSSCDDDQKKRALWYILVMPLFMIRANYDVVMKLQNPTEIKEVLLNTDNPTLYNPFSFIPELLLLIQQCFVNGPAYVRMSQYRLSQYLPIADKAAELEAIRKRVEMYQYQKELAVPNDMILQDWKKVQIYNFRKPFFSVDTKYLRQNHQGIQEVTCILDVISIRNSPSLGKLELLSIRDGRPELQLDFTLSALDLDLHLSTPDRPLSLKLTRRGPTHSLLLDLRNSGTSLGQATIPLSRLLGAVSPTLLFVKLHPSIPKASPITLELQARVVSAISKPAISLLGYQGEDRDLMRVDSQELFIGHFLKDRVGVEVDAEVLRVCSECANAEQVIVKEKILKALSKDGIKADNGYQNLDRIKLNIYSLIPSFSTYIRDPVLTAAFEENPTHILLKFLCFNYGNTTLEAFTETLFSLFNPLSLVDLAKLVHQIYKIAAYPILFAEVLQLVSMGVSQEYAGIVEVTQQAVSEEIGFLDKLFGRQQDVASEFNVTVAFRETLNQVLSLTGKFDEVNLKVPPFNNINFWLPGNNIKAQNQTLTVTVRDPRGNQHKYKYSFSSSGLLDESSVITSIPIQKLYESPLISYEEFYRVFTKEVPMIGSILSQILFQQAQTTKASDLYSSLDVSVYEENGKISVRFGPEPRNGGAAKSQALALYNPGGNSSPLKLGLQGGLKVYEEDTFLTLKAKISQSLKDRAGLNIMTEFMQFRSRDAPFTTYNGMDRINTRKPSDVVLDLVRVDPPKPQNLRLDYPSYALYVHPSGQTEWKACSITPSPDPNLFTVRFEHERHLSASSYLYPRQDLLFSLADKGKNFRDMLQDQLTVAGKAIDANINKVLQKLNQ